MVFLGGGGQSLVQRGESESELNLNIKHKMYLLIVLKANQKSHTLEPNRKVGSEYLENQIL